MVAKCLETFDFDVHPAQPLHLRVIQRSMTVIFLFFPRGFFVRRDVVVLEQPWSGTTTVKLTSCDIIPRVNIKLFETEVKQLITQQTFHKSSVSPLNYITTPIKK